MWVGPDPVCVPKREEIWKLIQREDSVKSPNPWTTREVLSFGVFFNPQNSHSKRLRSQAHESMSLDKCPLCRHPVLIPFISHSDTCYF